VFPSSLFQTLIIRKLKKCRAYVCSRDVSDVSVISVNALSYGVRLNI